MAEKAQRLRSRQPGPDGYYGDTLRISLNHEALWRDDLEFDEKLWMEAAAEVCKKTSQVHGPEIHKG